MVKDLVLPFSGYVFSATDRNVRLSVHFQVSQTTTTTHNSGRSPISTDISQVLYRDLVKITLNLVMNA